MQSYALIIVAQVVIFLSQIQQFSCSSCPDAPVFDPVSGSASLTVYLNQARLGKLRTVVSPNCLADLLTPLGLRLIRPQPLNLTITVRSYGLVDCSKTYLFVSGNITGAGEVSLPNHPDGGLSSFSNSFSYQAENMCNDLYILYSTDEWIPGYGPTVELFYAQTSECEEVLTSCSVSSDHRTVCLPREWRCNGRADCAGGIDESECLSCCTQLYNSGVCYRPDHCLCVPSAQLDYSKLSTINGCNGASLTTRIMAKKDEIYWKTVISKLPQILPLNRSYELINYYEDVNFTISFVEIVKGEYDSIIVYYKNDAIDLGWMKAGDKKTIYIEKTKKATLSFVVMSPSAKYNFTYTDDVTHVPGAAPCNSRLYREFNRPCGYNDLCHTPQQACNQYMDCPNGKDELGCGSGNSGCSKHEIMCVGELSTTSCFKMNQRCDGFKQCSNGYDELGCDSTLCGTHNGTYLCSDGLCIFETWKCDKTKDCTDGADEQKCEGTNLKVVTASVIGSLVCAIMIVIAVGCSCKLHTHRMYESIHHRSRYESPMTRITNELMRRAAPPPYAEAMQRSRPFEEVQSEYLAALAQHRNDEAPQDSGEVLEEERSLASASGTLDVTDTSLVEMSDDNTVSFRRNPNKPLESSEHSQAPLLPALMDPSTTVLEPKSDDEEVDTHSRSVSQSYTDNAESINSAPSRRQAVRHNSIDSDVSLLSRDSDDVLLLS